MDGPACASRADAGLGVLEGAVAEIPSVAKWPGHTAVGSSAPGGMRVSKPHLALQLGGSGQREAVPARVRHEVALYLTPSEVSGKMKHTSLL